MAVDLLYLLRLLHADYNSSFDVYMFGLHMRLTFDSDVYAYPSYSFCLFLQSFFDCATYWSFVSH